MTKQSEKFKRWLKREKMTTEAFAQKAGVSYNTAMHWRQGIVPRPFFCRELAKKFPDCPLFRQEES